VAVAQQLYQDARQHQRDKQWVDCEMSLDKAIGILETPGLRFHLAFCKEQQHRWVEALVDYRRASQLLDEGANAPDVAELLPAAIKNLEEVTPSLQLMVHEPPEGVELYLDGKRLGAKLLGSPIPVDPGGRRVDVVAPDHQPFTQVLNLLPKDRRQLRIELVPDRPPAPARPAPETGETVPRVAVDSGPMTAQVVVLATEALFTLGALGTGVWFTSEAAENRRARDRIVAEINSPDGCADPNADPRCVVAHDADRDAINDRRIASVGYIAAGVGAATFLATWLLWPDPDPEEATRSTRFALSARGLGVALSGRF